MDGLAVKSFYEWGRLAGLRFASKRPLVLSLHTLFVDRNPLIDADFAREFSDELDRKGIYFFEADAALAHVEFVGAMFRELIHEPFHELGVRVNSHMIDTYKIFLRCQVHEGQGELRVAVISVRENGVWDDIGDHSVTHGFAESFGQVFANDFAQ